MHSIARQAKRLDSAQLSNTKCTVSLQQVDPVSVMMQFDGLLELGLLKHCVCHCCGLNVLASTTYQEAS